MSLYNPVRAFESYLERAGEALISASPGQACALMTKAVAQFDYVVRNPEGIPAEAVDRMRKQVRTLRMLANEGERITSSWLETIAPAAEMQRNGGVDIYG